MKTADLPVHITLTCRLCNRGVTVLENYAGPAAAPLSIALTQSEREMRRHMQDVHGVKI